VSAQAIPVPSRALSEGAAGGPARAKALEEALGGEERLLAELADLLRTQRTGVSSNDLDAVDASVYGAQRILLTLKEARRRRHSLLRLLTGRPDVPLADFEHTLGARLTDGIRLARSRLLATAQALAREIEINRAVLQGAMDTDDTLIRALCGATRPSPLYGEHDGAKDSTGGGGALIDRQV